MYLARNGRQPEVILGEVNADGAGVPGEGPGVVLAVLGGRPHSLYKIQIKFSLNFKDMKKYETIIKILKKKKQYKSVEPKIKSNWIWDYFLLTKRNIRGCLKAEFGS